MVGMGTSFLKKEFNQYMLEQNCLLKYTDLQK